MEAVLPIAQPKEDHLSKPTIRIEIPLLSKSNSPTIVDIAEVMAKYREQLGESSEDEDYQDGEEELLADGEDEGSDSSDSDSDDGSDSLDEEIEERELSPSEIENMLPTGPKVNRFSGVIERIERMYGGEYSQGRKQDDYDFEDSFIDDSDWKTYTDAPKTKHDGFFINKGAVELAASDESESSAHAFQETKKKRKRSLDKDDKDGKAKDKSSGKGEKKERPKKKSKAGSADSSPTKEGGEGKKGSKIQPLTFQSPSGSGGGGDHQFAAPKPKPSPNAVGISPSTEAALKAFEHALTLHPVGENKRLPRELEPYLHKVAVEAQKAHPQGKLSGAVAQRLAKCLPINEHTIKKRMKRVIASAAEAEEESLEDKIEGQMQKLKERVDRTRALQGPSSTAKWKWDREAGLLLRTIIELVEAKVELHNKLHEKDTEMKLSDRKERQRVAAEIAKFWPEDQMKAADILRKNSAIKAGTKKKAGTKPDGDGSSENKETDKKETKDTKETKETKPTDGSSKKESKKDDKGKTEKEKKKEKKKEEKKKKKEDDKKAADKKASVDDRKTDKKQQTSSVPEDKKASTNEVRVEVRTGPPQPQPAAPIVRQAPSLPVPAGLAVTKVTAAEEEDVIILS